MVKYGILYVFYRLLIKTLIQRAQPFHTDLFLALPDVYLQIFCKKKTVLNYHLFPLKGVVNL